MKKEQLDDRDTDSKKGSCKRLDQRTERVLLSYIEDNYGRMACTRIGKIWSLKEG
jgi:hypothetical protein